MKTACFDAVIWMEINFHHLFLFEIAHCRLATVYNWSFSIIEICRLALSDNFFNPAVLKIVNVFY